MRLAHETNMDVAIGLAGSAHLCTSLHLDTDAMQLPFNNPNG